MKTKADHRDIIVGSNIRAARHVKGYSQDQLASKISVSYQQLHKYEKGVNRISATMLYEVSIALEFPVVFFYNGLEGNHLNMSGDDMVEGSELFELYQLFKKLNGDKKRFSLKLLSQNLVDD